jgi:tetratricopeptide (TPR) repeat protein
VKLWDIAAGAEIRNLRRDTTGVAGVTFSPDGRTLASAAWDGNIRIWNATTGEEMRSASGSSNVAYSPDGRTVASALPEGTVKLWNAATGNEAGTLHGVQGSVLDASFSPDGRTLASVGWDRVKLWDVATGKEGLTFRSNMGRPRASYLPMGRKKVAFSPNGQHVAAVIWDTLTLWDVATGEVTATLLGRSPSNATLTAVAYSPDGQALASAGMDTTVRLWDLVTSQEVLILRADTGVWSLAFSPDGRQLAAGLANNTVKIWDATPLTPHQRVLREARSVVVPLLGQSLSIPEIVARLRNDRTLSAGVRDRALGLVETLDKTAQSQEALRLVESMFEKFIVKDDVVRRLRASTALREPVREKALRLAEAHLRNSSAEGNALAEQGRWEEAAAACTQTLAMGPQNERFFWFHHVILRQVIGDRAGYRTACKHMLAVLERTNSPEWLELTAHAWVLSPESPSEIAQALELAKRRAKVITATWSDHVLGLALYRAGRFSEADAQLRASLARDFGWEFQVLDWLVLAMAQQKLGRPVEARTWLERSENWVATRLRGQPGGDRARPENWYWRDGLLLRFLLLEARAVTGMAPPDLPDGVFARP